MKQTYRDEWRVLVTLTPRRPADLGLTGLDDLAEVVAPSGPITVAVLPRRLGKLAAGMSVPDSMMSRDIEGDYRRRCEDIAAELRQRPQVAEVTVTCTETHTCSHCRLRWEVLTADEAADPACWQDERSVEGEPVCCDRAIAEFRAERGIPPLAGSNIVPDMTPGACTHQCMARHLGGDPSRWSCLRCGLEVGTRGVGPDRPEHPLWPAEVVPGVVEAGETA
ncbi:hypothetical protein ACF1BE_19645 [Streptomyces sp. NPDC014991]|uniref:hypothetical protein n=1 Tax=Streptomyces sp. NPDC014991 TaxID=3364935 RepID=UPI0036F95C38